MFILGVDFSLLFITPCGQPTKAEQLGAMCRQITRRHAAAGVAMLALLIGLALSAHNAFVEENDTTCPVDWEGLFPPIPTTPLYESSHPGVSANKEAAEKTEVPVSSQKSFQFHGPGPSKFIRQPEGKVDMALPTILLARARAAVDLSSGRSASWPVLEACATWIPPATADNVTAASELFAQLECNGELLESGAITSEAGPALLARVRQLIQTIRDHADLPARTWGSVEVEWARITHGVFQLNCKAVVDELQMSRRAKASTPAQQQNPALGLFGAGSASITQAAGNALPRNSDCSRCWVEGLRVS